MMMSAPCKCGKTNGEQCSLSRSPRIISNEGLSGVYHLASLVIEGLTQPGSRTIEPAESMKTIDGQCDC